MRQRRGVVRGVVILARRHRHRLRRVPSGHGEGQGVLIAGHDGVGVHRHIAARARHRHRDNVRGLGRERHRVDRAPILRHGQRRRVENQTGRVVVGDGDRHTARHRAVAAAAGAVRQRRGVVRGVVVLARRHRHRLHRVPGGPGEGQGVLIAGHDGVGVHRHIAARARHSHRDNVRGLGRERHRVGRAAALRHGQRRPAEGESGGVVVGDGDRHSAGDPAVATASGAVGQRRAVVRGIIVLVRRHRHRLHRAPGGRGEGQGVLIAGHDGVGVYRHIAVISDHRHRHVARGLGRERHRVGRAAALRHGQRRPAEDESGGVVVGDGDRHKRGVARLVACGQRAEFDHHRLVVLVDAVVGSREAGRAAAGAAGDADGPGHRVVAPLRRGAPRPHLDGDAERAARRIRLAARRGDRQCAATFGDGVGGDRKGHGGRRVGDREVR